MTFRLGLTGSIGMGKSTTAKMFADLGCDVWDADQAVARLYARDGAAIAQVAQLFPSAVIDGAVEKDVLRGIISEQPEKLKELEAIIHPLVRQDRDSARKAASSDIMVFDIPLLFETGAQAHMDAVACVFVDPVIQKQRVMSRGTMDETTFNLILSKQMPSAEKCDLSDFVIDTTTMESARHAVETIVKHIREG